MKLKGNYRRKAKIIDVGEEKKWFANNERRGDSLEESHAALLIKKQS